MANKNVVGEESEEHIFLEDNIPENFKDLDQTFRCLICSNLFDKAVTIKECGHTFCSVCINMYWVSVRNGVHRQEKSCPICRTTVNVLNVEKALVMNRSIQEGVKAFKQLLINHHRSSKSGIENTTTPHIQSRRKSRKRKSPTTVDCDQSIDSDEICSASGDDEISDDELPIQHKIQSRNYSRMKKKELQKLCREYKISTSGSEQELIDRLRTFQNMWNAELLHSIDPQKPSDIAARLMKQEKAQHDEKKREQMYGGAHNKECIRKLNATLKSGDQKVTSGNMAFDKKLKTNFEAMTAELKSRMKKKVKSSPESSKTSVAHKSIDSAHCGNEKELSCDVKVASSIEIIDIETQPDLPNKSIEVSNSTDSSSRLMATTGTNLVSSKQSSFDSHPPTPSITKSNSMKPVDTRSVSKTRSSSRKRRTNPLSSIARNQVDWACNRCTYINKGVDYLCQICGGRRS